MAVETLVVIEAPGKRAMLHDVLRATGLRADVWATRGHLRRHATSLWPLGISADGSEPGRTYDGTRYMALRRKARGQRVIIATDPDQEGDVIARDVRDAVVDVARSVERVRLHALDHDSVRAALAAPEPFNPLAARAGDTRRMVDRLIGHACSQPGRPAGRVFTALLGFLAVTDPVVGHVTLRLPAQDGGRPFVAVVPVTASTAALWRERAQSALPLARATGRRIEAQRKPWGFVQTLLRAALTRPAIQESAP